MSFLPEGTTIEKSSGQFMKLEEGEHRFRVLDSAIVGVEYWTEVEDETGSTKRRPVRVKTGEEIPVGEIDPDSLPKKFWAFPIYNYAAAKIQTLQLTQKSIMEQLLKYTKDEDFGDPQGYDLVIERVGKGMETRYGIIAKPPKPLDAKIVKEFEDLKKSGKYDLNRLWEGGYPLVSEKPKDEINLDDVKF